MKNTICLFDMDGTLTPPRQKAEFAIINKLKELSKFVHIGIVTGSDFDYITQQCNSLFDIGGLDPNKVSLFPCNGTKHYEWSNAKWKKVYDADMIGEIGQKAYADMLSLLLRLQGKMLNRHNDSLLFTGTFFQYRGSMLNWCPIGRSAGEIERDIFEAADFKNKIRQPILEEINKWTSDKKLKLTTALGGATSFDIYPDGWDKTYVLSHLNDYTHKWFVGDKCQEGGNDKALYDVLQKSGTSYEAKSVDHTIELIDHMISVFCNKDENVKPLNNIGGE